MGVLLSELLIPGWAEGGKMAMTAFAEGNLPCHNVDPETFFSETKPEIQYAKALCGECPMRVECLKGALERQEPCGIWGGELFEDGKVIAQKRTPGRPRLIRNEEEAIASLPTRVAFNSHLADDMGASLEMVG